MYIKSLLLISMLLNNGCSESSFSSGGGASKGANASSDDQTAGSNNSQTPTTNTNQGSNNANGGGVVGVLTSEGLACGEVDGLIGRLYDLKVEYQKLPDFANLTSTHVITAPNLDVPKRNWNKGYPGIDGGYKRDFAIVFIGMIHLPETGVYRFKTNSDDGSKLFINDILEVNNDGLHSMRAVESQQKNFETGWYKFKVEWYQGPPTEIGLQVYWQRPSGKMEIIPTSAFKSAKDCDRPIAGSFADG